MKTPHKGIKWLTITKRLHDCVELEGGVVYERVCWNERIPVIDHKEFRIFWHYVTVFASLALLLLITLDIKIYRTCGKFYAPRWIRTTRVAPSRPPPSSPAPAAAAARANH